jgi:hypothetical protein
LLFAVYCLLFTVYCLLFPAYCLLFTDFLGPAQDAAKNISPAIVVLIAVALVSIS